MQVEMGTARNYTNNPQIIQAPVVQQQQQQQQQQQRQRPIQEMNSGSGGGKYSNKSVRMALYRKGFCITGFCLFVLVVLLMTSFGKVEYNEIAFRQRKSSGTVYRDKVYTSGRYWIGPDFKFLIFPASIVDDTLRNLDAWTRSTINTADGADGDAGSRVLIDLGYQYQIIPEKLDSAYALVGTEIRSFVKDLSLNIIKSTATNFSSDQFIQNRRFVESYFKEFLKKELEEKAFVKLIGLQLRQLKFQNSFIDRKLAGAVQILKNDAESYKKEATLIRAKTSKDVKMVTNEALRIQEEAKANSTFLTKKAENQAARLRQDARHQGLKLLSTTLNITKQKHLLSLDYMVGMINSEADFYVDFDTINKMIN